MHGRHRPPAAESRLLRRSPEDPPGISRQALTEGKSRRTPAHQGQRRLFQMLRILGNMSDADRYRSNTLSPMETRDIQTFLGELFERLSVMTGHAGIALRFANLNDSLYCLIDVCRRQLLTNRHL